MNFLHLSYLPGIAIAFCIFLFLVFFQERRFFSLVRKYWFYRRSFYSWLSTIFLLTGMALLLISLLDARGPEEKIKTPVPTERTIILLDTSASMLSEDVKPSRLQKGALLAKHFARKAAGHQISIVAFAEIQKKIVPFTNDLDLIDARLDSVKNLRNHYGSSALTLALQESIQYFLESNGEARGNILVITDGEETAEGIKLKIPKEINVALVGVGTSNGGRIPLDDSRGFRFGYKKDRARDVITKLNENFFRKVVNDIPSSKYWLANTYSLPSEEILDFFQAEKRDGTDSQDMIIRPVLMEWLVVPALVCFILCYFFRSIRIFALLFMLFYLPVRAQNNEEQKPELPAEVQQKLLDLERGKLSKLEKIKLADDLYQGGSREEALELYEENLSMEKIDPEVPPEAYLNYGTGLLEMNDPLKGLSAYETLKSSLDEKADKSKKILDAMEKNAVTYFKQQDEKKEQQKKDQQDKKDQKNNKQDGAGKKNQQGEGQSQPDQNKSESGDQKKPGEEEGKEDKQNKEDKDKSKEDGKSEEDEKEKDKPDDQANEGEKEKKTKPQVKLTPKLKQLMSDDRQLQMKIIENGTRDLNKRKSRSSKDW